MTSTVTKSSTMAQTMANAKKSNKFSGPKSQENINICPPPPPSQLCPSTAVTDFCQREKNEAVSRLISVQELQRYYETQKSTGQLNKPTSIERKKKQNWETTELDLITPVTLEPFTTIQMEPYGHNNASQNHHSSSNHQKKVILQDNGQKKSILTNKGNSNSLNRLSTSQISMHFVHSESLLSPESRTNSQLKISQKQQKDKGVFCCEIRRICLFIGLLIVVSALGLGIGIPISLMHEDSNVENSKRSNGPRSEMVRRILAEVPLIDGHNDLAWNLRKFLQNQLLSFNFNSDLRKLDPFSTSLWSQTDLLRMRIGMVGAQLWSAYVPCNSQNLDAVQIAMEQIDVIRRLVEKYPDNLRIVTNFNDIERAHREKKIASIIGIEGGHAIRNSLGVLRMFYELGSRYLTLTHNCHTPWADSASSENHLPERGGLTEFGKLVVLEMNRLGMIVDLAHVSAQTMRNALEVSRAPVIFSHSAAFTLCNHSRNVPDDILRMVASKGGLVMISFYNVFIACNDSASINDVVAHIKYIRNIAGIDHVGIGAGFDGINLTPNGLEDVSKYPNLLEEILKNESWTELDIKKVVGINFLRVFKEVESVRDEWKKNGVKPIEEWIPRTDLEGHSTACNFGSS